MTAVEVGLALMSAGAFVLAWHAGRYCDALKAKLYALEDSHRHECNALRRDLAKCRRDLVDYQIALDTAVETVCEAVNPNEVITLAPRKEATYEH